VLNDTDVFERNAGDPLFSRDAYSIWGLISCFNHGERRRITDKGFAVLAVVHFGNVFTFREQSNIVNTTSHLALLQVVY
jgi:hypothetical protein